MRVSFNVAKLAKERGFNLKCSKAFYSNGVECNYFPYDDAGEHYFRPTQSKLQTWLREFYKVDVLVIKGDTYLETLDKYAYRIPANQGGSWSSYYDTYEEALEKGFEFALQHNRIINKEIE